MTTSSRNDDLRTADARDEEEANPANDVTEDGEILVRNGSPERVIFEEPPVG